MTKLTQQQIKEVDNLIEKAIKAIVLIEIC
jgi:hypothetical protein